LKELVTWAEHIAALRGKADRPQAVSPVGIIFIVMIIFMPQGLLGFARRWLNR